MPYKLFGRTEKEKFPILYEASIIPTPNHTQYKTNKHTQKTTTDQLSHVNSTKKILNKIRAKRIQHHIKKIHHDQVKFTPGMQDLLNIEIFINII